MANAYEGLLSSHNFTNGEHYYTVTVHREGGTDKPVFHLEEGEEALEAILQYNEYADLTELLNNRLSDTEVLVKETNGTYEIAVDAMKKQS